jgi:hypothetical protein
VLATRIFSFATLFAQSLMVIAKQARATTHATAREAAAMATLAGAGVLACTQPLAFRPCGQDPRGGQDPLCWRRHRGRGWRSIPHVRSIRRVCCLPSSRNVREGAPLKNCWGRNAAPAPTLRCSNWLRFAKLNEPVYNLQLYIVD